MWQSLSVALTETQHEFVYEIVMNLEIFIIVMLLYQNLYICFNFIIYNIFKFNFSTLTNFQKVLVFNCL